MVEYRRIKTKNGLTKEPTQDRREKIPETFATELIHDDNDVRVTSVPQKSLTADCWLVQFNGFESCTNCPEYLGKECGGGATLAKMIIEHFSDSIMTKMQFNRYWGGETDEEELSFFNFVKWSKTNACFRYSFKKFKHHIKKLQQIATEPKAPDLDKLYPFEAHYKQPNNKITSESGYHQSNACNCVFTSRKGSNRDVIIEYSPENGPTITLHYYHQHCIMKRICNTVWLNSAGFRTVTTKKRLNGYLRNYRLEQSKSVWYLRKWRSSERVDFYDGIELEDI